LVTPIKKVHQEIHAFERFVAAGTFCGRDKTPYGPKRMAGPTSGRRQEPEDGDRAIAWAARFALRTAAASDRGGAAASFHGSQFVTDMPNSPHLQASKTKAQFLIAIATNAIRSGLWINRRSAWLVALRLRCVQPGPG
jgi:hypothetical protein